MKKLLVCTLSLAVCSLAASVPAGAQMNMEPYQGSPEFERMKGLIGVWQGDMPAMDKPDGKATADHSEHMPGKMTVEYRLTAGGSAILETTFPGTPMEMVSLYHDRGGKLSMTHYCALGNQPRMALTGADDERLEFAFFADNDIDPATDMHMCGLALVFVDEDNITQHWTVSRDGAPDENHDSAMQLTRLQ